MKINYVIGLVIIFSSQVFGLQTITSPNHAVVRAKINHNITSVITVNHDRIYNAVSLSDNPTLYIDKSTGILYINDTHEKQPTVYLSIATEKERHFTLFLEKTKKIVEPILINYDRFTNKPQRSFKKRKVTRKQVTKSKQDDGVPLANYLNEALNHQPPTSFKPNTKFKHGIKRLPTFAYEIQESFKNNLYTITLFKMTSRVKHLNLSSVIRQLPVKTVLGTKSLNDSLLYNQSTTMAVIWKNHANT